jgi:hypothetical protein
MNLLRRHREAPMLDDLRNHDALPSEEESAWMQADAAGLIVRALALAAIALLLGLGASVLLEPELTAPVPVAAKSR